MSKKTAEEIAAEVKQMKQENEQLLKELTKKNDQFMFDLKKVLANETLPEEREVRALNSMLQALVDGQKTGVTAKQLYGTPTEAASKIKETPDVLPTSSFSILWLDNSLVLFSFLAIITSMFSVMSKESGVTQGITSLVIGAISGGLSFYFIHKYVYVYNLPGADQSKKPGFLKSTGIMALCFIPWLFFFSMAQLLPATVNPSLDPMINLVLGAAAFGGHYLLKKKYNIQGSLFTRPPQR
ncbi:DUF1129 domain-containing protein [Vagococcus silagei]|uniref:DUF1129 family protein n=1 Tax=Vagococcus silagei TaxID=2508885 RepID=A0A4S3B6G7_9ENTE|nr:DUF1129 family protein [Vagococcus silagei]THB60225.1 DUF1129 family protein [Vagococcus silagei]